MKVACSCIGAGAVLTFASLSRTAEGLDESDDKNFVESLGTKSHHADRRPSDIAKLLCGLRHAAGSMGRSGDEISSASHQVGRSSFARKRTTRLGMP